jgi:large subunit ribosomal protein L25
MAQEAISLTLDKREVTGKAVKHLRTQGIVPAVIHDHGKPSLHVQGNTISILKVWQKAGKHHPIQLIADGKDFVALIKIAEFDPRKHQLKHVVFNAVDANQTVEAEIPLHVVYSDGNEASPAERSSLIVLNQLESVEVRTIPTKLPDFLEYNGDKLIDVGDHVTVEDIIVPEGVEIVTEKEHAVATVYEPSALAAANEATAGLPEEEVEATDEEAAEGEGEESSEDQTDKPADGGADKPADN